MSVVCRDSLCAKESGVDLAQFSWINEVVEKGNGTKTYFRSPLFLSYRSWRSAEGKRNKGRANICRGGRKNRWKYVSKEYGSESGIVPFFFSGASENMWLTSNRERKRFGLNFNFENWFSSFTHRSLYSFAIFRSLSLCWEKIPARNPSLGRFHSLSDGKLSSARLTSENFWAFEKFPFPLRKWITNRSGRKKARRGNKNKTFSRHVIFCSSYFLFSLLPRPDDDFSQKKSSTKAFTRMIGLYLRLTSTENRASLAFPFRSFRNTFSLEQLFPKKRNIFHSIPE